MKPRSFRLSSRITIGAIVIMLAGAMALIYVENARLQEVYLSERQANLEQRLHAEKLRLIQSINTLRKDVLFLSNTPAVSGMARHALNRGQGSSKGDGGKVWEKHLRQIFSAFSSAHSEYHQISYISVADGLRELVRIDNHAGKVEVAPPAGLQAEGDLDIMKAPLDMRPGEVYLSEFGLHWEEGDSEQSYLPVLRVATPVFSLSGQILGVVMIYMDASNLLASASTGLPEGVQAYMSNMGGEYLLHPDSRHPDSRRSFGYRLGGTDNITTDFPSLKTMFNPHAPEYFPLQAATMNTGTQYLAAERIHFDRGDPARFLMLMYNIPGAVAAQQIARIPARHIIGGFIAMLLVSGITLIALRRTFAPLQQVAVAADKITAGNHDVQLPLNGSGEIGSLANALNTMLARLSQREQEVIRINEQLNALIEAIPDAIFFKDGAGRWLVTNEPAKQLFQLNGIPWQGKTEMELADLHPAFRAAHEACLVDDEKAWDAGQLTIFEENVDTGDGGVRNYDVRKIPLFGDDGRRKGLVIIGRDITEQKWAAELLRKSAEEIEDLYNRAPCGYHSLDKDGIIRRINDTELAWLGYTRGEVVGKMKWPDLLAPASAEFFSENFSRLMKQGFINDIEIEVIRKDGSVFDGLINAVAIYGADGNFVTNRATMVDITRRTQAEEKLRESDIRLRKLVGNLPGTVFEMVGSGSGKPASFSYVSESVAMLLGVAAYDLLDKPELLLNRLYGEDVRSFEASQLLSAQTLATWDWEGRIDTAAQHDKWVNLRATPHRRDDGMIVWDGVVLDITKHKNTEIELVKSRQLLRELAAQGEALLEEERKRIAREVHDELGQIMTALRMDVSLLRIQFGGHAAALEKIQGMIVLLDRAMQCARDIVSNLRPTALDMGIVSAVEWLCNEFAQHTGTVCTMRSAEEYIDLDEARAVVAFRLVQESLTNVARHAEASGVEISMAQHPGVLHVAVRDNGKGFDPVGIANRKSFGLLGMRERAIALGGNVDIISAPQQGTTIVFNIPTHQNPGQQNPGKPDIRDPNGDIL